MGGQLGLEGQMTQSQNQNWSSQQNIEFREGLKATFEEKKQQLKKAFPHINVEEIEPVLNWPVQQYKLKETYENLKKFQNQDNYREMFSNHIKDNVRPGITIGFRLWVSV